MNRCTLATLAVTVLLLAGCSSSDTAGMNLPECGEKGSSTTFLMAQAVPDATLIPCIASGAMPASWSVESMKIDSAGARLTFIGDMSSAAPQRVEVLFGEGCNVTGAVSVPSDERGTERFERVESVAAGYVGQRSYVFDGGCVMYRFNSPSERWSTFVHDASTVWTFMPSADVVRLRNIALGPP
jgi:hypothetical protein